MSGAGSGGVGDALLVLVGQSRDGLRQLCCGVGLTWLGLAGAELGLAWAGLSSAGLGGLGWAGPGRAGLGWNGLGLSVRFGWIGWAWVKAGLTVRVPEDRCGVSVHVNKHMPHTSRFPTFDSFPASSRNRSTPRQTQHTPPCWVCSAFDGTAGMVVNRVLPHPRYGGPT